MAIQKTSFVDPFPFELYLPGSTGPFPLICLTPILGRLACLEDLFLERRFALFFAAHGLVVALIERPFFEFNPARGPEQIQEYLEGSVLRAQKVLDLLVTRDEIQSGAVGSFGMSFGGVVNTLWAACDPRLRANIFALVGGNIPEILVSSRDPLMRSYLQSILKGTGLDKKSLKIALEKSLRLDPLKAASSIPKESVLMLLGIFDRVIRFRYGLALWRALGKPETIFVPLGHYPSLLVSPFLKWKALAFFKKKLDGIPS